MKVSAREMDSVGQVLHPRLATLASALRDHTSHRFKLAKTEQPVARFKRPFQPRIGNHGGPAIERQHIDIQFRQARPIDGFTNKLAAGRNVDFGDPLPTADS